MLFSRYIGIFLFLNAITFAANADDSNCATTHQQLEKMMQAKVTNGKPFTETWIETTADDGKPLKIILSERDSAIYFTFDKTSEGIWAEGPATICLKGSEFVTKLSGDNIKVGKKAPLIVRLSMGGGATFHMKLKDPSHMHVSTFGWRGDFIPVSEAEVKVTGL